MNRDVHLAALRAAARVAFSMALPVALVSGCSAEASNEGDEQSAASQDELIKSGKAPCHEDAGKPTKPVKPSCDAVLASAFPGEDKYQWEQVAQSADVVACCDKELTDKGAMSKHRWSCCVAYDPATVDADAGENGNMSFGNGGHGMACTPWGPPVPPSMDRRRKAVA